MPCHTEDASLPRHADPAGNSTPPAPHTVFFRPNTLSRRCDFFIFIFIVSTVELQSKGHLAICLTRPGLNECSLSGGKSHVEKQNRTKSPGRGAEAAGEPEAQHLSVRPAASTVGSRGHGRQRIVSDLMLLVCFFSFSSEVARGHVSLFQRGKSTRGPRSWEGPSVGGRFSDWEASRGCVMATALLCAWQSRPPVAGLVSPTCARRRQPRIPSGWGYSVKWGRSRCCAAGH